jgi:hypothetical protein
VLLVFPADGVKIKPPALRVVGDSEVLSEVSNPFILSLLRIRRSTFLGFI